MWVSIVRKLVSIRNLAGLGRVGLVTAAIIFGVVPGVRSQPISPDSTLGTETSIVSNGVVEGNAVQLIEGGATRGGNLFHSFSEFNLGLGESVYFANPINIDNILSRVTGNSPSNIDGVLGVAGSADLFLLNPNGILFGPNARLDIGGSFTASTANSILFSDGSELSITAPTAPRLSISVPVGVQFNTPLSQGISNRTDLQTGQHLTLSGSTLFSEGLLAAGGNITLQAQNDITVRGIVTGSTSSQGNARGGGNIVISSESGNITTEDLSSSSAVLPTADPFSRAGAGGNITITANSGNIVTGNLNATSFVESVFGAAGNGGNISLSASSGSLQTKGLSTISLTEFGAASNGGNITLASEDTLTTENIRAGSFSLQGGSTQNGGGIQVFSRSGDIATGQISTASRASEGRPGNGGKITIHSTDGNITINDLIDSTSTSFFFASRAGGNVDVSSVTGNIILNGVSTFAQTSLDLFEQMGSPPDPNRGGGTVVVSSDFGDIFIRENINTFASSDARRSGRGGNITLTAQNGSISGRDILDRNNLVRRTQLNAFSSTRSSGDNNNIGDGGTVTMVANAVSDFELFTLSSAGESGNVNIQSSRDNLSIARLDIATTGQSEGAAFIPDNDPIDFNPIAALSQSGDTFITSLGDITLKEVAIQSNSNGVSRAGDITVIGAGQITFDNSQINSNAASTGSAGNIALESASLRLGEGDLISAATSEAGTGGTITINTTESVLLGEGVQDSAPIISVEASGEGRPGNIVINTPNFVLSETARITATSTATATNPDSGGSIDLNANQMDLAGIVGIFAETQGQAPGGILTLQPYQASLNQASLDNPTESQSQNQAIASDTLSSAGESFGLTLAENSRISASTTGSGNGGGLQLLAPDAIAISGPGRLAVETSGTGRAGNITANARRFTLTDGVTLSASTTGPGIAGDITFNIADTLTIDGSTVESRTAAGSSGRSGNINVFNSGGINLINGGRFSLNSDEQGIGGDLTLTAGSLTLDNSNITAVTRNSNGGNFTFNLSDYLLLRNGSLISTEAGTAGAGGNGGSIAISVPNGFIVALPNEDSDIRANAFEGNGGNVNITARNLLGIAFRPGLSDTPTSDITSSSQFGNSGVVTIEELNPETLEPEVELPVETAPATVARGCRAQGAQTGSFVSTGRGGLPTSPVDPLSPDSVWQDLAPLEASINQLAPLDTIMPNPVSTIRAFTDAPILEARIVEAQSWTRASDGSITLLTEQPDAFPVLFAQASGCY